MMDAPASVESGTKGRLRLLRPRVRPGDVDCIGRWCDIWGLWWPVSMTEYAGEAR